MLCSVTAQHQNIRTAAAYIHVKPGERRCPCSQYLIVTVFCHSSGPMLPDYTPNHTVTWLWQHSCENWHVTLHLWRAGHAGLWAMEQYWAFPDTLCASKDTLSICKQTQPVACRSYRFEGRLEIQPAWTPADRGYKQPADLSAKSACRSGTLWMLVMCVSEV